MDSIYNCIHFILGIVVYCGLFVSGDSEDRDEYGRDICTDYDRPGFYSYCEEGYYCCENNTKCCTSGLSVAAVVGIVLACLFLVGLCFFCSLLLAKKKKLRPNQLVSPGNTRISTINQQNIYTSNNVNIRGQSQNIYTNNVSTRGQSQNYLPPSYSYGLPPPQYDQSSFQPIPYSHSASHGANPSLPPQPPPYCPTDQSAPPAYKPEP